MHSPANESVPSFKSVLLATDFSLASQAAFETALCVCKTLRASLCILHVFEEANAALLETGGQFRELDKIYKKAEASLDDLVQVARRAGVTCEAMMGSGMAEFTIPERITSKEVDLAILGTNALHGFERLVFGSTAEAVLRQASCPVLTVGPQAAGSAKNDPEGPVIFATDFHLTTTHAIRHAASFSKIMGSPLHCLHVLPRTLAGGVRSHIIPQIMTEALQHVANDSGTVIDPPVCAVAYGSEISNTVVDYARQQKAKLIVLGVRRASMASHLPAHIAYRIITEAPCPVLTIAYASQPHATLAAACL
jgi:nucleotide-binding universal stress UspA family protein